MNIRHWTLALLGLLLVWSTNAHPCFTDPNTVPTSEISTLELRSRPKPSAIYAIGGFEIHAEPEALYTHFKTVNRGQSVARRYDLENGMRAHTPFRQDFDLSEMVESLIPEHARRDQQMVSNMRARGRSQIEYALGALLEAGQAALLNNGVEIRTMQLEVYSALCSGGKRFRLVDGEVVLEYTTWVS